MARPLRDVFHGAWYHVMNRGAAHRTVFRDPADARDFIELIQEIAGRFRVETHAYCLMGNHYHLLLRTPEPNLSEAMRHVDGVLSQRLNRRHSTDGPVFRGRFCSVLVQADRHLVCTSRYIHLNPVEAGLVRRAELWGTSSYQAYLGQVLSPPWLHTGTILGWFGSSGARQRYREFVEAGLDRGTRDFYGRARIRPVLGDEFFVERVRREAESLDERTRREMAELRGLGRSVPLVDVAREIEKAFCIDSGGLALASRRACPATAIARGAFVYAARRVGSWRLVEIATWLGYAGYTGPAQVAARYRAAAEEDPTLAEKLRAALAALGCASPPAMPDRALAGAHEARQTTAGAETAVPHEEQR